MTRNTTKKVSPPDLDKDGAPGGSLPAGLTAAAEGAEATGPTIRDTGILASEVAELIRSGNTPQEVIEAYPDLTKADIEVAIGWVQRRLDRMEQQTDEANTAARVEQAAEWTRDNQAIADKLDAAGVRDHDENSLITVEQVTQWPDEDARAAEAFADAMTNEGAYTDDQGDERNEDGSPIELPAILAERHVLPRGAWATAPESNDDTFTPEEIAAGQTPVIEQEGEATATAAEQATTLDATDPVTTIDTATAPITVRLSELAQLTGARRLYLTDQGYSAIYAAPFIATATVDGWVAAGLAEVIPTAGNKGGVRATDEARRLERQLRREQAEAA